MARGMGGSQSKFKPEAQDVWFRMKITGKQPKFLQTVMQAIADLREFSGSSQSRIIEYIREILDEENHERKPRNVTMQVKKALKHAVAKGFLKQRGGKFQLTLNKKDFAIFKSFRVNDPLSDCGRCKREKKRAKSRRGRGKRRKHQLETARGGTRVDFGKNIVDPRDESSKDNVGSEESDRASSIDSFRRAEEDSSNTYIN